MVMSTATAPLRFPGFTHNSLAEMIMPLVPSPRLHFLMVGYTPLSFADHSQIAIKVRRPFFLVLLLLLLLLSSFFLFLVLLLLLLLLLLIPLEIKRVRRHDASSESEEHHGGGTDPERKVHFAHECAARRRGGWRGELLSFLNYFSLVAVIFWSSFRIPSCDFLSLADPEEPAEAAPEAA
jgi:hypothetical protein